MTFLFLCFHPYFLLTLIFVAVDILWKYWCSGFLFVLRSIWINWHVDVVVLSVRGVTYEKKKQKNKMESGREHSKTHMVAFTSQICTFLHFLLIFHFYNFHITFYHFSFLFFFLLFFVEEKQICQRFFVFHFLVLFLSHLHVLQRARVFALQGRVSVFLKICACNFSRRVCVIIRNTLSHQPTPWKVK